MWRWPWDPPLLRVVIVNLKSDPDLALRGVLWSRGPWFTLRQAELLRAPHPGQPAQPPTPLDGEAVVHRSNVAFFQVVS
jgi:hypothetical protein